MSSKRVVVRVSEESMKQIKRVATDLGLTGAEAVDRLVRMGVSRHNALAKYAKRKD